MSARERLAWRCRVQRRERALLKQQEECLWGAGRGQEGVTGCWDVRIWQCAGVRLHAGELRNSFMRFAAEGACRVTCLFWWSV